MTGLAAMSELLDVAIRAAKKAGSYVYTSVPHVRELQIEEKSLNDYVSEVDRESERIVRSELLKEFPDHCVLGEEFGAYGDSQARIKWIIDPLDGTTNFLRGIPHYAVSIAALADGKPVAGVVFDPAKDELFCAVMGDGATLNGVEISVTERPMRGALLATGVPYSGHRLEQLPQFLTTMESLLGQQTSGIRRLGSAALDLAYVAAGRYDGFWEASLSIWDIAAGVLLVGEAGGQVSDFAVGDTMLDSGNIVAANRQVHSAMLTATSLNY